MKKLKVALVGVAISLLGFASYSFMGLEGSSLIGGEKAEHLFEVRDLDAVKGDGDNVLLEVFSPTCHHCATATASSDEILTRGGAKVILRPVAFDGTAVAAISTVACRVAREEWYDAYKAVLKTREKWITVEPPQAGVEKALLDAGFSMATDPECEDAVDDRLVRHVGRVIKDDGVKGTPTFFYMMASGAYFALKAGERPAADIFARR